MKNKTILIKNIKELVGFYRGMTIDAVEQEMEKSPEWQQYIRPRLLKIFGDRGLEGKLIALIQGGDFNE